MKRAFYIITVTLFAFSSKNYGQYHAKVSAGSCVLLSTNSAQLSSPASFRGSAAWQVSGDSVNWTTVYTSANPDTLSYTFDSTAAYRLSVTEGSCNPVYSDIILLGVFETIPQLLEQGFDLATLLDEHIPLVNFLDDDIPVADLLDVGCTADSLLDAGATIAELINAGVSAEELISLNADFMQLFAAGVGVGTLRQNGIDSLALADSGLIGTMRDFDGTWYPWVKIGEQVWMAANLGVTHFRNGGFISTTYPPNFDISSEGKPKYWWAANGVEDSVEVYGRLYTNYVIDSICPTGWHVPTLAEWNTLSTYLGGVTVSGGKLKSTGTEHWQLPNTGASNSSGFNAMPAGSKRYDGSFGGIGFYTNSWTSTLTSTTTAYYVNIDYNSVYFRNTENNYYRFIGYSIRCLKN